MAEHRQISVEQLLAAYSSHELSEWRAYYSIYPEPQERAEIIGGNIAATMYNAWRGRESSAISAYDYVTKPPASVDSENDEPQEVKTARTFDVMGMLRGAPSQPSVH
jgi:hypothetical protein